VHSAWHFTLEATEDLTHADSRLWRTLSALVFKPGFLTREFLAGRRARYLPPLRLYLVLSVVFFLSIGSHQETKVVTVKKGGAVIMAPADNIVNAPLKPGETPEQRAQRACNIDYNGFGNSFLRPFMRQNCEKLVEDQGRTVGENFMHNIARAMFIFLPVLALLMKLMYWRPRRYFVVHTHAFAFLLLSVLELLAYILPEPVSDLLGVISWCYLVYYVFTAMRKVYGQGMARTLVKLTILTFAYISGFAVMMAITGIYSVWSI
jgi:hypothetical protein